MKSCNDWSVWKNAAMATDNNVLVTKVESWSQRVLRKRTIESMPAQRILPLQLNEYKLTLWDKIKLIPALFIILKGHLMGDLKTTIGGVVKLGFQLATVFGIGTGHLTEAIVTSILWGIASIYQSYQQADKK